MYKAKISFCGIVTAHKGQELEITNEVTANDLLKAGYIEKKEVGTIKSVPTKSKKKK